MTYFINAWTSQPKTGGGFAVFDELGTSVERREFKRQFTRFEGELLGVIRAAAMCASGDRIVIQSKNTVAWVLSANPKSRPDLKQYAERAHRLVVKKHLQLVCEPKS